MQVAAHERDHSKEPRNLQTMQRDYEAYIAHGSERSQAKEISHSVVSLPLMTIAIDHVSFFSNPKIVKLIICKKMCMYSICAFSNNMCVCLNLEIKINTGT